MSAVSIATDDAALIMMRKGGHYSARDLVDMFGIAASRAHSIVFSICSTPRYEIERVGVRPTRIKVIAVDGERTSGPCWFEVLLYSQWPLRQQVAA